jgi:hypothetical protein
MAMTRDDITRMAQEAGFVGFDGDTKCLREFANIVAEAEREECAKICDATQLFGNSDERWAAKCCSEAIRARGNT